VVREISDDPKRRADVAAKRAAQLFERQQDGDRCIAEGEKRRSDMVTKTARLREQRLARNAAEADVGKKNRK
jgi:hypothetical protein